MNFVNSNNTLLLKEAIGLPIKQSNDSKIRNPDIKKTKLLKLAIGIPDLKELYKAEESESPEDKKFNKSVALMNLLKIDSKNKMFERLWEKHFMAHMDFWIKLNEKREKGLISETELNNYKFHALYDAWWDYWDNFKMKELTKIEYNMENFYKEFLSYYEIEVDNFKENFIRWKNNRYDSDTYGVIMLDSSLDKIVLKTFKFNQSWSLPKGKKLWYKEESDFEAAIRESKEETGFNCKEYIIQSKSFNFKINNCNCKLYPAVGISTMTEFNPNCKGESDQAEFISFSDIISNKKKVNLSFKQINEIKDWIKTDKNTILKFAVSRNLLYLVKNIKPDNDHLYECGNTLLHIAVKYNNLQMVKLLISYGFNINYVNNDQYTPLMMAALQGNYNILSFLVKCQNIILDKRNSKGCTALGYLALSKNYNYNCLELLLKKGCDIFITLDHIFKGYVIKVPLYYLYLSNNGIDRKSYALILSLKKNKLNVFEDSKKYECYKYLW